MAHQGIGYKGSSSILTTSSINTEICPSKPQGWTISYRFYKFELRNYTSCTIKINGSNEAIYLNAGQGFAIDENDAPIYSLIIVESNTQYSWVGAF